MRIVVGGVGLTVDQVAGRTCCYCPLTFGRLDPVLAPAAVEGVMFLAAHQSCFGPSTRGARTEEPVAASGRRERSRDD